ncbi:MAG: hypothetical protein AAFU41_06585 [Pseudomonadota bacterium]
MRNVFAFVLIASMISGPAIAQACPPAPDHAAEIAAIEDALQLSKNEMDARVLNNQLWELWLDAPDPIAQEMLDDGMARRAVYDFLGAREILSDLITYCPDYAEGYNQRAFASYLAQDFEAALADLDATLAILPNHIGALSGKALTLMGLGRQDEAQDVLRAALALNPWLQERHLLTEPAGTDL